MANIDLRRGPRAVTVSDIDLRRSASCVVAAVACLLPGCSSVDRHVVGPQFTSGVARLTSTSFGLLIYPCGDNSIATVEVGMLSTSSQAFDPIMRETFDPPISPRSLVVSTAPDVVSPGADREVINESLLRRVNEDSTFSTAPWPPLPDLLLVVRAFGPGDSVDVSGSADIGLNQRFQLALGQVNVDGTVGSLSDFQCPGTDSPAWEPTSALDATDGSDSRAAPRPADR